MAEFSIPPAPIGEIDKGLELLEIKMQEDHLVVFVDNPVILEASPTVKNEVKKIKKESE